MSARDAAPERASGRDATRPSDVQKEGAGSAAARRAAPAGAPDDLALVERAKTGDRAALRQLIERYERRVYQLALGILKDGEEALDVVQETFIKVHQHLPGFKGDAQFFTWVYRIAYNLSIDAVRKRGKGERVEVEENTLTDEGTQFEPYATGSQSPQKAALRGELSAELQRALSTLSENHRAILLLREVDGLSYEELSQTLKIPKGTVMSRLFHARHKMQAAMAGYLGEDAPAGAEGDEPDEGGRR